MPRRNLCWLLLITIVSMACYRQGLHNRYGRSASDVLDQISRRYFEPVDDATLFQGAVEGMLGELKDDYSAYISPAEQQEFEEAINKRFEGVGMEVSLDPKTKELTVISPLVDSPAYEAGVRAGDRILKIDGRSTKDMSLKDSVEIMHGKPGTAVALCVLHEGERQPVDLQVVRRTIVVDTVRGDTRNPDGSWNFLLAGREHIGYVRITGFAEKTTDDLRQALDWLADHQMRGLILDVRDNPGGLLDTATEVCDLFLPAVDKSKKGTADNDAKVIVTTRGREGQVLRRVEASGNGPFTAFPMVVLVNQYSASASEIVAACLQDHHRAQIVGQRTWGKGTVQEVIDLGEHRGELKLTVASYWRPSGKNIHRRHDATPSDTWGVSPDKGCKVVVEGEDFKQLFRWRQQRDVFRGGEKPHAAPATKPDTFVDRQLAKAIACVEESLRKKPEGN
jgi:carboxyl-terminal processing protease